MTPVFNRMFLRDFSARRGLGILERLARHAVLAPLSALAPLAAFAVLATLGAGATLPTTAHAADSAIAQLRRFTSETQSATGHFTQQLIKQDGSTAKPASGDFAFARPGRFRWEIRKPYEQLIITDGAKLWFYDKDLEQVTVRKATETIGATPAALLFGSGDLDGAFELSEITGRDGLQSVEAKPRTPDSGFEKIVIGMRDGLPVSMEVRDAFGQVNRFGFESIERNPRIAADAFTFTPPPGVDVIE